MNATLAAGARECCDRTPRYPSDLTDEQSMLRRPEAQAVMASCTTAPAGGRWSTTYVRDYGRRPDHHEVMLLWATGTVMTRKLCQAKSKRATASAIGISPLHYTRVNQGSGVTFYEQALRPAKVSSRRALLGKLFENL